MNSVLIMLKTNVWHYNYRDNYEITNLINYKKKIEVMTAITKILLQK